MMYLGIEGRYDDVAHHTIYLSKSYEQNLRDIEQEHTLTTEDASFYVQNAGVTDNTLAPTGMSTLYVLLPVTHEHEQRELAGAGGEVSRHGTAGSLEKIGINGCRAADSRGEAADPGDVEHRLSACISGPRSAWLIR